MTHTAAVLYKYADAIITGHKQQTTDRYTKKKIIILVTAAASLTAYYNYYLSSIRDRQPKSKQTK